MPRVVAISTNPALDRVLVAPGARRGGLVHATRTHESAGGKAAQAARVASALGAEALLVAPVGGPRGARYRELLADAGVAARLVAVAGETRQTTAIVDDGDLLELHEPGGGLSAVEAGELVRAASAELRGAAVAIVSGSLPPGAPVGLHAQLVRAARDQGAFTILDSSTPEAFTAAAGEQPDLVKPNLAEASRLEGREPPQGDDGSSAAELGLGLAARLGTAVWLTLAERGSLLIADGRCVALSLAPRGAVRNAVGAGDALIGGLAAGLCRGLALVDAAALGVAAAAEAVTHEASAVIDRRQVERAHGVVEIRAIE